MKSSPLIISFSLFILIFALINIECSAQPDTSEKARGSEYAIYLSPGFNEKAHWGGYHVTIAEFSNKHALGKSQKKEAKIAWNKANAGKKIYTLKNKKYVPKRTNGPNDYWTCDLKGRYHWSICFNSDTLYKFAKDLKDKHGFRYKKEPAKTWHISLYANTPEEARKKFETPGKVIPGVSLKNAQFSLYEVRAPSPPWDKGCINEGKGCKKSYWTPI